MAARELPHEFLTRFGLKFIVRCYLAFVESPHATALADSDPETEQLNGALSSLPSIPQAHYASLVRRHSVALAWHAALRTYCSRICAGPVAYPAAALPARHTAERTESAVLREKPATVPELVTFPDERGAGLSTRSSE